ncbi:unnamed protein product [Acidithrix sp. C25]|nr:unnamed protein product [Acidithrix sp. C25]
MLILLAGAIKISPDLTYSLVFGDLEVMSITHTRSAPRMRNSLWSDLA